MLGLLIGFAVLACGGSPENEFDEDPEGGEGGDAGKGGAGGTGGVSGGVGGAAVGGAGGGAGRGSGGMPSAGSGSSSVCTPGSTQKCLGPGACEGAQRCANDGRAWEDCDCGSAAGGSGGVGGGSGTGGASGTGGGGGSAGSSGDPACKTEVCADYCDFSTGHCPEDVSLSSCMTWCMGARCEAYAGCLPEHDAYLGCVATGTPVCVEGSSLPDGVDCHAEGKGLFDCLELPWHCDEENDACICGRAEGAATGEAVCAADYECCVADAPGVTCGCGSTEFCEAVGEGFASVSGCPLD
jgi:hypothetical protein